MSELKRIQKRLVSVVEGLEKLRVIPVKTKWGEGYNDGISAAIRLLEADLLATNWLIQIDEL